MTLIIGFNFSDKVCIAGDTRVTDKKRNIHIDNIMKVFPLWGSEIKDQEFFNKDSICVAVAGDVDFATYLYKKIEKALNNKELSSDIRIFSDDIKSFIRNATDEWLKKNRHRVCYLIFSGMTHNRRKRISVEKLEELKNLFRQHVTRDRPSRDKFLIETLPNDPTCKLINDKMQRDAGKGVEEMLKEGDEFTIPKWVQNALDSQNDEIEMPDSLLVGIKVDSKIPILEQEIAEWGEFIAYGAGLTKDNLPNDLLATLELSHNKSDETNSQLLEDAIITTSILDIAKKYGSIGGTVILLPSTKDGKLFIKGKDIQQEDGKFVLKLHGQSVPLIPFHKYPIKGDLKMMDCTT